MFGSHLGEIPCVVGHGLYPSNADQLMCVISVINFHLAKIKKVFDSIVGQPIAPTDQ